MEQIYMLEIFIDKISILLREGDPDAHASKELIIIIKFAQKIQFIIKGNQLAVAELREEVVDTSEPGIQKLTRTVRVGKSFFFPAFPDQLLNIFYKYPLEFELWTDDGFEVKDQIGSGNMVWDTGFIFMVKENQNSCEMYEPLSMKMNTTLDLECCCIKIGEVDFIIRISALGEGIVTDFQQLVDKDPDIFVFRTNRAPSLFECKRIEPDDKAYNMQNSQYEIDKHDDPDVIADANKKIDICTELQSCGVTAPGKGTSCQRKAKALEERTPKVYPIDKIKLGDITGPCGNANCPLVHKIKTYIRNMHGYRLSTLGQEFPTKPVNPKTLKRICGKCACKHDDLHRDTNANDITNANGITNTKTLCSGCGGMAQTGETCDDRLNNLHGTGLSPIGSKSNLKYVVNYLTSIVLDDKSMSMFKQNFIVYPCEVKPKLDLNPVPVPPRKSCSCGVQHKLDLRLANVPLQESCSCVYKNKSAVDRGVETTQAGHVSVPNMASQNNPTVYNFCLKLPDEKDKDCKCDPPFTPVPCNTLDCECLIKAERIESRKRHKPFCPSYKHKLSCPCTTMYDEVQEGDAEEVKEEPEPEPLPYGLPPVQIGPCPVLARPCTVPDGFNRMYKTAVQPNQPPSWSDAGKICCSREYERIKNALKEFLDEGKKDDYRCLNKFNVDTERRCCDKEQRLLSLLGKSCCGRHKLEIQDVYNEKFAREASEKMNAERSNK